MYIIQLWILSKYNYSSNSPLSKSHSLHVLSILPVAISEQSKLNWALLISAWWPTSVYTLLPLFTSHTITVLSKLPVIRCVPVVLNDRDIISAVWPCHQRNSHHRQYIYSQSKAVVLDTYVVNFWTVNCFIAYTNNVIWVQDYEKFSPHFHSHIISKTLTSVNLTTIRYTCLNTKTKLNYWNISIKQTKWKKWHTERVHNSLPVSTSHILAVVSILQVATLVLLG